jgi:hypothetical protein
MMRRRSRPAIVDPADGAPATAAPQSPTGGDAMSTAAGPRILVIANRTSSTPTLLDTVAERARTGASFTLLIPPEGGHHDDWSRQDALELLERSAGGDVASLECGDDALDTVHRAVSDGEFGELIVCTAPEHLARWVHHDLPHRLEHLGLPVLVIPPEPDVPIPDHVNDALPNTATIPPLPGSSGAGAF